MPCSQLNAAPVELLNRLQSCLVEWLALVPRVGHNCQRGDVHCLDEGQRDGVTSSVHCSELGGLREGQGRWGERG